MRKRRTKGELETLKAAMHGFAMENRPASVRQIFYHGVSVGLVEKTERGYQQVGRHLTKMRETGELPIEWISDPSRAIHSPYVFRSVRDFVEDLDQDYRRDPWQEYERRIEAWCESRSIAGVI